MATKQCEACDTTIGESEKTCPACGVDLETLEEEVAAVDRANTILQKRKAKVVPAPTPELEPKPAIKKGSIFRRLALKNKEGE